VAVGERPAASRRLPDGTASRRAALLTGRSPTAMKQVNINDRWYNPQGNRI